MLQPVVRRTWAPRGQTPLHYSWDRHDRLSAISAITVSPRRRRLGLYFRLHSRNIRFEEVMGFIRHVHRRLGRKFILVLDRYSVHRKAVRLLQGEHTDWLEVEWLPPYAPELNPTEQVWNHTKYSDLANYIPEDRDDLREAVNGSLADQRSKQSLLRSFFQHAKLKL